MVLVAAGDGHLPLTSLGVSVMLAAVGIPTPGRPRTPVADADPRPGPEDAGRSRLEALDATHVGTWSWRVSDGRVWTDEGFLALAGLAATDLDGRFETLLGCIHPEDLAQVHSGLGSLMEPGSAAEATLDMRLRIRGRDRDGAWRPVRLVGGLVRREGAAAAVGGIALDDLGDAVAEDLAARTSDELIQALAELSQANADLERVRIDLERRNGELESARRAAVEATVSKSEFLANMSHEIRTPLSAIIGFAELIADGDEDLTDTRDMAATIRRNGEHLLGLVGDVLDLSKIEAGRMEIERIPCEPARLLHDVVESLRPHAEGRGIELHVQTERAPEGLVSLDPTRFRQVALNLVGNAIKFTEHGGVVVRIDHHVESHRLEVSVTDTGIGLDDLAIQRIFEPFRQADGSTTRRFGGTGLGLSISRTLCELLGGELSVASIPGRGSTFTAAFLAPPSGASGLHHHVDAVPTGLRILLAEDGPDNRRLVMHLLGRLGSEVTPVENGAEAVDRVLDGGPWDLVLLDMQMPVMDGWEAARRIRNAGSRVPIVALTANALPGDREACLEAGCDEYLAKPIRRETLVRALSSVLPRADVGIRPAG